MVLCTTSTFAQDLTFDSVRVTSPYWGAEVQTFTGDSWYNCGSTNTNFVTGQTSKALYFPINIANFGTQPAFLGLPGVTPGVNYNWTQPGCWTQAIHGGTAPVAIDSFVTMRILDECKNEILSNKKNAWYFQNNGSYVLEKYNGVWNYFTNYFGAAPTTGTAPNPTKDWIEGICGPIDTNKAIIGGQLLYAWDTNCQQCDSLILFPNHYSSEPKFEVGTLIQLPLNFAAGNYYLELDGNFSRFETEDCLPNKIQFPFVYNGSDGFVAFQSQAHTCTPPATPVAVLNVQSQLNNGIVLVTWAYPSYPDGITGFEITPIFVQGNTERTITGRTKFSTNISVVFDAAELRSDAISLGAGNGPAKYKFVVRAVNGTAYSAEVKTRQALNIK
jgi:hypothetical protein